MGVVELRSFELQASSCELCVSSECLQLSKGFRGRYLSGRLKKKEEEEMEDGEKILGFLYS